MTRLSVDITIPVLNEERALEGSLNTLASYLSAECPYDWSLTIADNGSTDRTWAIAESYASGNVSARAIQLERPGRGGAVKEAWFTSGADVVAYMDVDLSTGLESLRDLLDPIVRGEADISIGSRLVPGARVERSVRREVTSRIFNGIARGSLRYGVRDAHCGFKAARASVARDLIPRIEDDGWFFDVELLTLARRDGLRINEIPVRWVEDDDSRVRIVKTALADLRGIWRLLRAKGDSTRQSRSGPSSQETAASHANDEEGAVDLDS
jgi:glycosyltransferase involved in cell wall biosynthesis